MPDPIKESFFKVKEDILSIKEAVNTLSDEMSDIRNTLELFNRTLIKIQRQTEILKSQTDRQITPTDRRPLQTLNSLKSNVSIGNEGVPTDRQTDQQTDRHIQKFVQDVSNRSPKNLKEDALSHIDSVSQVLNSLDTIKKDLRLKFKKLTSQEIHIFSLVYQFGEQGITVDYSILAEKTNLSQSSIRDYILKLIKKGIPLEKNKENNKQVILSISPEFKKLASLNTILSLREL